MRFDARRFLESLYEADSVATLEPEPLPDRQATVRESERGYLIPDDLPEPWREWYEERAAIREYDGGQAREHAEAEALKETLDAMRAVRGDPYGAH